MRDGNGTCVHRAAAGGCRPGVCFQLVLSGDSLPAKKPDPLPLLHIARCFETTPAQVLVVAIRQRHACGAPPAARWCA